MVLHYLGADDDRGGIVSVVRALETAGKFQCVLGVNPGFQQRRQPALPSAEFGRIEGEELNLRTLWRARRVAGQVREWLKGDRVRFFHGHTRSGLAVALWLAWRGEERLAVTVHCYGRQRWFYRWAAGRLGRRLFWLTPAMKSYYRIPAAESWDQCMPGCLPDVQVAMDIAPRRGSHRPLRFAGIGALVAWKRWDWVLEAISMLPQESRAQIRFAHAGGAEKSRASQNYAGALRAQTTALGLDAIVTWRGAEPSSRDLLTETDCLIVPSQNEPFSMVMLEALAIGVPVLAAASGGPRDVITPGENGWLFAPDRPDALAHLLRTLLHTDALQRVRITAEQLRPYRASTMAGKWLAAYRACTP